MSTETRSSLRKAGIALIAASGRGSPERMRARDGITRAGEDGAAQPGEDRAMTTTARTSSALQAPSAGRAARLPTKAGT